MKKLHLILFIIAIAFANSCKKDEVQSAHLAFTFGNNYLVNSESLVRRMWILIYSSKNELLALQEVQNGQTYQFDSLLPKFDKGSFIQLATLYNFWGSYQYLFIDTYLDVKPGTWNFPDYNTDPLIESIGTFTLNLNNFNSTDTKVLTLSTFNSQWWIYTVGNPYLLDQYVDPDKLFVTLNKTDNTFYYKWFDNIQLNENLSLSPGDMTEISNYVDISSPSNNYLIISIYSEDNPSTTYIDNYLIYDYSENTGETSVRVYYPNNVFSGYYTFMYARNNEVENLYYKTRGNIPSNLVTVNAGMNVLNQNISSFSANSTGKADIMGNSWANSNTDFYFDYYISYPFQENTEFVAPELPDVLKNLNPEVVNINNLQYNNAFAREYDIIDSYDQYINFKFVYNVSLYEREAVISTKYLSPTLKNNTNRESRKKLEQLRKDPYSF